ncbi:MAG: AAA family ATPase [Pseudomonadota bacterium]
MNHMSIERVLTPDIANPYHQDYNSVEQEEVSHFLSAILSRWILLFSMMILAAFAGAFAYLKQPLMYKATSVLVLERGPDRNAASPNVGATITAARIESELQILSSRLIAERVVDRLGLADNATWLTAPKTGFDSVADTWPGIRHIPFAIDPEADRVPVPLGSERAKFAATNRVMSAVSVQRRGISQALAVTTETHDRDLAAAISNTVTEAYIDWTLGVSRVTADETNTDLQSRLSELETTIEETSAALQRYSSSVGLDVDDLRTRINELELSLSREKIELIGVSGRLESLRQLSSAQGSIESIPDIMDSPVINRLNNDLFTQTQELEQLRAQYGELHPVVIQKRAAIEQIEADIFSAQNRVAERLENDVRLTQSKIFALEDELQDARTALRSASSQEVERDALERDLDVARQTYQRLLDASLLTPSQASSADTTVRLISAAIVPNTPVSPNLAIYVLMLLIGGAALGVFLATLMELLNTKIYTAEDIQKTTRVPMISALPAVGARLLRKISPLERHPPGYLLEKPLSSYGETVRLVFATLRFSLPSQKAGVFAVTSAVPGEGKTTTALAVARAAAISGDRVAFVECDFRRGSVSDLLRNAPDRGVQDVLLGGLQWQDISYVDSSGATILPAVVGATVPSTIYSSDHLQAFIDRLRDDFDFIVLDCPPVLLVAEARMIAQFADAAIVIARSEQTTQKTLRTTIEQLMRFNVKIAGVVLNAVDKSRGKLGGRNNPIEYSYDKLGFYQN